MEIDFFNKNIKTFKKLMKFIKKLENIMFRKEKHQAASKNRKMQLSNQEIQQNMKCVKFFFQIRKKKVKLSIRVYVKILGSGGCSKRDFATILEN